MWLALGYASLYNHGPRPNLRYAVVPGPAPGRPELHFTAAEDVREGEELRVSYGREWWRARGRAPRTGLDLAAFRERLAEEPASE